MEDKIKGLVAAIVKDAEAIVEITEAESAVGQLAVKIAGEAKAIASMKRKEAKAAKEEAKEETELFEFAKADLPLPEVVELDEEEAPKKPRKSK